MKSNQREKGKIKLETQGARAGNKTGKTSENRQQHGQPHILSNRIGKY